MSVIVSVPMPLLNFFISELIKSFKFSLFSIDIEELKLEKYSQLLEEKIPNEIDLMIKYF